MAIFKYYLEKRKDKEGEIITKNVPIIYSFSFDGYRIKTYSGERIDLKHITSQIGEMFILERKKM